MFYYMRRWAQSMGHRAHLKFVTYLKLRPSGVFRRRSIVKLVCFFTTPLYCAMAAS